MRTLQVMLLTILSLASIDRLIAGDCCCCPDCGEKICTPQWEERKVEEHCYCVECKDVCIPKFRWPWECCLEPKCGRVRTVNVLKKIKYECKKCGCVWEVQSVGSCNGCCDGNGCQGESCGVGIPAVPKTAGRVQRMTPPNEAVEAIRK